MNPVPSILKQTRWPVHFVNYGRALDIGINPRFFNASIIENAGKVWLVSRRAEEKDGSTHGMNSIWTFQLNDQLQPVFGQQIPLAGPYKHQHFEDPRITRWQGRMWLSFCTFVVNPDHTWHGAHQGAAMLMDDWQVSSMHDPLYGDNGGSVLQNTGNEKNWLWFEHESDLMCVYMTHPHKVLKWTFGPTVSDSFNTEANHFDRWEYGHARGGTPPVRVGDEYWSFFHSSIDGAATNGRRRYYMGAYAFEAKPPFAVTRVSKLPILIASEEDPFYKSLPAVVFPSGALLRDGEWTVSLGVNDCATAVIRIPHGDIEKETAGTGDTYGPVAKPAKNHRFSEDGCGVAKRPKRRHMARRRTRKAAVAGSPANP